MYKILSLILAYFERKNKGIGNKSQSRHKLLYISLAVVYILHSYDGS